MLRIAVTGTRGVPATWGGVEHQCEQIYSRLAARGHQITIYARNHYVPKGTRTYRGITIKRLPTLNTKYAEAFLHTLLSTLAIIKQRPQIIHYYGQGPCLCSPLVRLFSPSIKIFFTCGGLDWQRKKWPPWASRIIHLGEMCSARIPHCRVVVSEELQRYYRQQYDVDTYYVPNGVEIPSRRPPHLIRKFGLSHKGYFLFVGRLVPEKRIEDIISAYRKEPREAPLVIVGDSSSTDEYVLFLKGLAGADPSILFLGYQYGDVLAELFSNALAFVTASELEGLPLTLLEALSYGLPCVSSDIPPHREILDLVRGEGLCFPLYMTQELLGRLREVELMSTAAMQSLGDHASQNINRHYSWDAAAIRLEQLYRMSLRPSGS